MTDVSEEFALLLSDMRRPTGAQLNTRPLGVRAPAGPVRTAVNSAGMRRLLVPVGSAELVPDTRSKGVELVATTLILDGAEVRFADLGCKDDRLGLVFEHLAQDLVGRLTKGASDPVAICKAVLDQWRSLLQVAGSTMAREAVVGLVGELEVMREIVAGDPNRALAAWRGPLMDVHDFVDAGRALEVKATAGVDPNFVAISNVDQLDPSAVDELTLAVVHCKEDSASPSIDERIDELVGAGVDRLALLQLVASAGYVYEAGLDLPRYRVRGMKIWSVGRDFPGLRSTDIPEDRRVGVSGISYRLDLDVAGPALATDDRARAWLQGWLT